LKVNTDALGTPTGVPGIYSRYKEDQAITPPTKQPRTNPEKGTIAWHSVFREAIQTALFPCRDVPSLESEYALNTGPLRIDVVIIKKAPDAVIDSPTGAMSKKINIIGYKSPGGCLSRRSLRRP
jgi:hypothetical protein